MFAKIWSLVLALSAMYVLAVFFAPKQADEIGQLLWISQFNSQVREAKVSLDRLTGNAWSISVGSGALLDSAKRQIHEVRQAAEGAKGVIETKAEQVRQVTNTIQQINDSANTLKDQVSNLTSFSGWTTSSWTTASGVTSGTGSNSSAR